MPALAGTDSQEVMEQRKTELSSSATNGINPTGPTLDVDCVHSSGYNELIDYRNEGVLAIRDAGHVLDT